MDADFTQLYVHLGLRPDCTLDQLKQAYRRRVAELHPDRQAQTGSTQPSESMELSELIRLYGTAMQFHRQHGRLPGATAIPLSRVAHVATPASPHLINVAHSQPRKGLSLRHSLVVVGMLTAATYLLLSTQRDPPPPPLAETTTDRNATPVAIDMLTPGLEMETVRAIQGTPSYQRETVWEYGPSWIRFEEGRLVEWYSSPLYPLHVQGASPPLSDTQSNLR